MKIIITALIASAVAFGQSHNNANTSNVVEKTTGSTTITIQDKLADASAPSTGQTSIYTKSGKLKTIANGGSAEALAYTTGSTTTNNCAKFDSSGRLVDAGAACNSSSGTDVSSAAKMINMNDFLDEVDGNGYMWGGWGNPWQVSSGFAQVASEAGHPGIGRITTAVGASEFKLISMHGAAWVITSTNFSYTFVFRLGSVADVSDLVMGFCVNATSHPCNDGITIANNTTNFSVIVGAGGATENTSLGVAWDTNWHKVTVSRSGSTITGVIDGGAPVTIASANPPTNAMKFVAGLKKGGGGSAMTLDIDWSYVELSGLTR